MQILLESLCGITPISADLSTGCSPDHWKSASRLQPGALFALAMPPLAPVIVHRVLQGVLAPLHAPTRPRSPQHRADLLPTVMRQPYSSSGPLRRSYVLC